MQYPAPSYFAFVQFQASVNGHGKAVISENHEVPYRVFVQHIERVTRRLDSLGLPRDACVGVLVKSRYLQWLVNIALLRMGVLSAGMASKRELKLIRPAVLIADETMESGDFRFILASLGWLGGDADALPPFQEQRHARETPARIVLSSGTTGTPKRVLITHGEMSDRQDTAGVVFGTHWNTRSCSLMGINTLGGYASPLLTWASGGTVVFPSSKPGVAPWHILRLETNALLLSPTQLEALVASLPADYAPIPALRIFVAGSSLPQQLSVKTRLRLTQQLFVVYGSTEVGTVSMTHAAQADGRPGFTGQVVPWVDVEVVDEEDRPVAPGTTGEVRMRSKVLVERYLDDDANEIALRGGWFYPGDAGTLDAHGGLTIVGRTRELINIGGLKLSPVAADEALSTVPGVKDVAVFGFDSPRGVRACAAVVAADDFDREALVRRFGKTFPGSPQLLVARVAEIPRNDMGKVLRLQLARNLRDAKQAAVTGP
ncbi:MAG TPA: class I adenylate-forming enzyme family protein [Ramlibacter sp.]|uniref:class I adenylate-forming enzyme family protein n=1 Tax=Ramlibacter sp. TaxID=1917967 RepID=UPI002C238758|nr:class I adenylate-forming enzyme family protein [Ramlibacter sp.]HVZ43444.1 class I adenylate-forming enzyme family protein [Ramlibacter sp.]